MLSPSTTSAKVLHPERLVDLDRRERALCRGDRKLLVPARRVAHDIQARNIRRLVVSGHHRALPRELTAQDSCKIRSLLLSGREEEGSAPQRRASFEFDPVEPSAPTDQPAHGLFTDGDAVAFAARARGAAERLAIGDEDHVVAPCEKDQRCIDPAPAAAVRRDRTVGVLVGITERTVMNAPTVEGLQPRDVRKLVRDTGREQQPPTLECSAGLAVDGERSTSAAGGGDGVREQLNGRVSRQLGPSEVKELERGCAISREEAVRRDSGAITRLPIVDDDDAPSTASEHERSGKSRRPGADDRDVVVTHASHTSTFGAGVRSRR
jgi:hypothetical protein